MEHDPRVNRDEQYPLLKVEATDGGGDTKPQPPPSIVTTSWTTSRTPKPSWLNRWPECMSACWMTIIVFAVSFLVFYSLGIYVAYRRQPVVVFKCNNSKPASDVYYHHVVQKGSYIPLTIYSEYLSAMAVQYPSLRFNVYFLVDDFAQTGKRPRLFKRLPAIPGTLNVIVEQSNRREIRDFQRRYQNVNITIMTLGKFMAKTPLKYKWKSIPSMYLPFYARILSVWQTGGIGIDLDTFNHLYNNRQDVSNKIGAILKQHNEGIETEKYMDIFNSMKRDDDNEIFSLFFHVIHNLMNQTSSFFNLDVSPDIKLLDRTPLVRTHRSKREIMEIPPLNNASDASNITDKDTLVTEATTNNSTETILVSTLNLTEDKVNKSHASSVGPADMKIKSPGSRLIPMPLDFPQVMIFYDFLVSDDVGPSYPSLAPVNPATPMKITEFKKLAKHGKMSNHLSVSFDGAFVAAPMCYHPFLTQLLSTGCKRENPSIAIKDTFMSQCSTFLRDDVYCDNIYIIDSIFN
ncbi:uncharacterized protein LOC111004229 [Pieris rapae]|uniref:uncharacterized protein LOC111004229 n=1 Tax=Pieris rapae TaxID=64459 RepID=UPI001E27F1CE|nr:uncharacterized protein LOC111004229 [Pieris rapae]